MRTLSKVLIVGFLVLVGALPAQAFEKPTFTDFEQSEMYWLALGIFFEARGEPIKGQLRVAEVILNRRDDRRWPNTIEGVVRQGEEKRHRCQFSFMCDGQPERIRDEERGAWVLAYDLARYLILKERRVGYEATCIHSYHADYATNIAWFKTLERQDQVGSHIFFCDAS